MTVEIDGRAWFEAHVPRETLDKLDRFAAAIVEQASQQNLVSATSIPALWLRHFLDSAQLISFAPATGSWLDIGSGAGFPGIIVATLRVEPITLVEPRRLRAEFLQRMIGELELPHASVFHGKVERCPKPAYATISARAVASVDRLFASAIHVAAPETIWVLPKGRSAAQEVAQARQSWQGSFTLAPSITDPEASILIARGVAARKRQ